MISLVEGDSPVDRTLIRFQKDDDYFARPPYLEEKLFERVTPNNVSICFQSRFSQCFLEELCHFQTNTKQFPLLLLLQNICMSTLSNLKRFHLLQQTYLRMWMEACLGTA